MKRPDWLRELTYLRLASVCGWISLFGGLLLAWTSIKLGTPLLALAVMAIGFAGVIFAGCAFVTQNKREGGE